jgi:hypothetical protein
VAKNKPRYLRLGLKTSVPAGVSDRKIIKTLLDSIRRGDYTYPEGWRVAIGWSNHKDKELRWGEWTKEMKQSAQSSPGFDISVAAYLENQL